MQIIWALTASAQADTASNWRWETTLTVIWVLLRSHLAERKRYLLHQNLESGVCCSSGKYTIGPNRTVTEKKNLQRIRVQLDYNMGQISFYDPEDNSHIYKYRDSFTEGLFPYLCIEKSGNATDLKSKSVTQISHH